MKTFIFILMVILFAIVTLYIQCYVIVLCHSNHDCEKMIYIENYKK